MQKANDANEQGLVISYFGNSVAVEAGSGQVFQCHLKRNQTLPVVGDEVIFKTSGVIEEVLPRKSTLAKGDGRGKMKPIAANIDFIFIVMAPAPIFSEYLVDRYLLAAELLSITPIIVLNKIDLLNEKTNAEMHARLAPYAKLYQVIYSSVVTHDGLDQISHAFENKSAVLVGPSGVGKSSIIAALTDDDSIRIGDVSQKGSGKHTTTATRLYHLPNHGRLIDSPGVREFMLWPVDAQDILRGFKEIKQASTACKFRDCKHLVEPGCSVRDAIADEKISAARYASYCTLLETVQQNKNYTDKKHK